MVEVSFAQSLTHLSLATHKKGHCNIVKNSVDPDQI